MFENRLFFVDKLVSRALGFCFATPTGRSSAARAGSRREDGEPRHPRRHGHAHRGAVRGGALGDREHPSDRPRLRTHRRSAAGLGAQIERVQTEKSSWRGPHMIHPIPPGTRDVLPDEMRELGALSARLREMFEEAPLRRGADPGARVRGRPAPRRRARRERTFRLFDEQGRVLVLRSDMTIPIARLGREPLRRRRAAAAVSTSSTPTARPSARAPSTEFLQGGIELIGVPGTAGDVEVLALTAGEPGGRPAPSPDRRGRRRPLPHAARRAGGAEEERIPLLELLTERRYVELEAQIERLGLPHPRATC